MLDLERIMAQLDQADRSEGEIRAAMLPVLLALERLFRSRRKLLLEDIPLMHRDSASGKLKCSTYEGVLFIGASVEGCYPAWINGYGWVHISDPDPMVPSTWGFPLIKGGEISLSWLKETTECQYFTRFLKKITELVQRLERQAQARTVDVDTLRVSVHELADVLNV